MLCNILKALNVTSDQLNASFVTKSIYFFKENLPDHTFEW